MRYLILTLPSLAYAAAISAHLYRLMRPDEVRDPADVSRYWCGWITHPETGAVALEMPEETIPVHPAAPAELLVAAIAGVLTVAEQDAMHAAILSHRGERAEPLQFLPASLAPNLHTAEEMEAGGWFATAAAFLG